MSCCFKRKKQGFLEDYEEINNGSSISYNSNNDEQKTDELVAVQSSSYDSVNFPDNVRKYFSLTNRRGGISNVVQHISFTASAVAGYKISRKQSNVNERF